MGKQVVLDDEKLGNFIRKSVTYLLGKEREYVKGITGDVSTFTMLKAVGEASREKATLRYAGLIKLAPVGVTSIQALHTIFAGAKGINLTKMSSELYSAISAVQEPHKGLKMMPELMLKQLEKEAVTGTSDNVLHKLLYRIMGGSKFTLLGLFGRNNRGGQINFGTPPTSTKKVLLGRNFTPKLTGTFIAMAGLGIMAPQPAVGVSPDSLIQKAPEFHAELPQNILKNHNNRVTVEHVSPWVREKVANIRMARTEMYANFYGAHTVT